MNGATRWDQLGIGPGWLALQRIADGHVVIDFVPPEHNRSLRGILAPYIKPGVSTATDEEWQKARETAWAHMAEEAEAPFHSKPKRKRKTANT